MDMRRLVGRNVLRIRKSKEMTQERLAEVSGLSQQYISGLEKGQRNPTVVTIYELSAVSSGRCSARTERRRSVGAWPA